MEPSRPVLILLTFPGMAIVLVDKITGTPRTFPDKYAAFVLAQPNTGWKKPPTKKKPRSS